MDKPTFYEFFAGGGMARAGLGSSWKCLFANDFDRKKGETYRANWGGGELLVSDVRTLETKQLPGHADLIWASFPCQDLSLAGSGAGLAGERSGTFWPFFKLVTRLRAEGRGPKMLVLENVCGALTSHGGKDFSAICEALAAEGYRFGAMVIDAAMFLPHSRPRLFIVAVRGEVEIPAELTGEGPAAPFARPGLLAAHMRLRAKTRMEWVWWRLPAHPARNFGLADLIEVKPRGVRLALARGDPLADRQNERTQPGENHASEKRRPQNGRNALPPHPL